MSGLAELRHEPWLRVVAAAESLASARSMESAIEILRSSIRGVAGSDGGAVALREGGFCRYVAEDADGPLWRDMRFPVGSCVCGWAMLRGESVAVDDLGRDGRTPQEAHVAAAVGGLVVVPIGSPDAEAAIAAWWREARDPGTAATARLEALARAAAVAFDNIRLLSDRRRMEDELRLVAETLEQRVEERTAELQRTQDALRQAQKLEAMGQLTGGVAHDFNNLLTPIMGTLDMLHRKGGGDARERRLIAGARQSAERAKTLVQRLLAFARRQPLSPKPVDLGALLDEMAPLLGTTVGAGIAIEAGRPRGLPMALADAHQIEMAILNLVVNARDAMPDGGRLSVSVAARTAGGGHPAGVTPGEYVVVTVADSGVGMSEEVLARAVEPFFSTKGIGRGTGLGLSMVHGLMSQLGGGLRIESRPGEGTAVELWLPVAGPQAAAGGGDGGAPAQAAATVLVVDDEELVRIATADMLQDLGYRVLEAGSGEEALRVLGERAVDLLVTDHLMPAMTGVELAAEARLRHPDIGVLVISGYSGAEGLAHGLPWLQKPFLQSDLAARLEGLRSGR